MQRYTVAHHNCEAGTTLGDDLVTLVGQIGDANWRSALGSRRSHGEGARTRLSLSVG